MSDSPSTDNQLPVSRVYAAQDIPATGIAGTLDVDSSEREIIARHLDLQELEAMRMDFKLGRTGQDRFKLQGHLLARYTQSCVITLEPVAGQVDEEFEIEFWTAEDLEKLENVSSQDEMTLALDGPEPLAQAGIDVGQLAYEQLAAAIDLYPRKSGAQFNWKDPDTSLEDELSSKPFSQLAALKRDKDSRTE